jgi:transcription antitermination factor NusG
VQDAAQWYAVYTRARHEKAVDRALRSRGLASYLPLQEVLSQWKDRRKWVAKPLFPGYLFVRLATGQIGRVNSVRGVVHVVGNGQGPIPVPPEQVEAVRRMVEKRVPLDPWPYMREGRRVRMREGPLIGVEGFIVTRRKRHRLVVSVDLLGRSVATEVDAACAELL